MIAAFAYLIRTSWRNRLLSQLRRIRSPRYALAVVIGLGYFWMVLFRQGMRGPSGMNIFLGEGAEVVAPLGLLLILGAVWLLGTDRSALAFSEAEVAMLFTAPVSRRGLIAYKLASSQIVILINALIWVFILRRGGAVLPGPLAALGFWALFSTISCHRLAVALVRASSLEYGVRGIRRNWLPIVVFAAIVGTIAWALYDGRHRFAAAEPDRFFATFAAVLSALPVKVALFPFRAMMAPTFAHTSGEWARAMVPALLLLAAHAWWVLRSDAAFEEAAAAASVERAKRIASYRARRSMGAIAKPTGGKRTIPLRPTGPPIVAIVWKNMICLMRTSQVGLLIFTVLVTTGAAIALGTMMHDMGAAFAVVALFIGGLMVLVGGRSVRNDLRSDMTHLPFLKAVPLSGTQIVLAEVASGALVMTAMEFLMLAIAFVGLMSSTSEIPVDADARLGILVAAPLALLAYNGAVFTVLNGAAVLFPAWMRLGPTGGGGIEAMGQIVLSTAATLLAQALLLLLPAAVAAGAFYVLSDNLSVAFPVAIVTGALLLMAESYVAIRGLGRAFARAEPQQIS
jgi:ABC-2 type transport system permease protein